MLEERVKAGDLPFVDERLPENPLVVEPNDRVGQYGGTLRSAVIDTSVGHLWCVAAYDNLLRWKEDWTGAMGDDEIALNLAEEFEVNDDATEFTFRLRTGMKWSDGEPFTADDVVFAVSDVLLNEEVMPVAPDLLSVDGGRAAIEKVDEYSFKIVFPKTAGLFLQQLAFWDGHLLTHFPRHYLEKFHKKYNPDVVELVQEEQFSDWVELFSNKSGPGANFGHNPELPSLAAWQLMRPFGDGRPLVFERNPYYWKVDPEGSQLPYIDEVVFDQVSDPETLLLRVANGDVNIEIGPDTRITTPANKPVLAQERETSGYSFIDAIDTRMNIMRIALNLTHEDPVKREIFRYKDFRIALSHAIDRQEIIDTTMQGQGEPYQLAPSPESPFYDEEFATQYLEYDMAKANEILDGMFPEKNENGIRLGPDGEPIDFTLEFVADFRPEWADILELIKGYWERVGVTLRPEVVARSLFSERREANKPDATVWTGDGGIDVVFNPERYFPAYTDTDYAAAWGKWYQSGGSRGEQPPDAAQQQMRLYDELLSSSDAAEQEALLIEILDIAKEQFYSIGVARETEKYFVVADNIGNVPTTMIQGWEYPTPGPTSPEQYFIGDR